MATKAQINANRLNAKKSTGPKTAEGKEAVAQNAFKHGLFLKKAVVEGESQEEYELHRQALLAHWGPVGEMESIVAERLVNLAWRLERAQRMQNQIIDYLGINELREYRGVSMQEAGLGADHLLLGRLAAVDWSNCRVIDRMMLYERRIENSMYKTMRELERLQKARKDEQSRTVEQQSAQESPPARRQRSDPLRGEPIRGELKKQSQSAPALMGTKSCAEKDYDDRSTAGRCENKANQSQSAAFGRTCAAGKGEIAAAGRARR
ncbi:MAG: hypothetical protein ACYS0H_02775 [Planctomycetota bacterium]|jgi:hypothetical protein